MWSRVRLADERKFGVSWCRICFMLGQSESLKLLKFARKESLILLVCFIHYDRSPLLNDCIKFLGSCNLSLCALCIQWREQMWLLVLQIMECPAPHSRGHAGCRYGRWETKHIATNNNVSVSTELRLLNVPLRGTVKYCYRCRLVSRSCPVGIWAILPEINRAFLGLCSRYSDVVLRSIPAC
jgi:hypothetical protein